MAKTSGTRQQTGNRKPAAGKSAKAKGAVKPSAVKKPASKTSAAVKAVAKSTAKLVAKPFAKSAAKRPAVKPIVKAGVKLSKPAIAAKPAKAVARTEKTVAVAKGSTSAQVSAPARPTKLATPSDRPAAKAAVPAPVVSSAPIEKPSGKIMLMQGPVAARSSLTKKGTWAPVKPGLTNGTPKPVAKPVKRREELPAQPPVPPRQVQPAVRTSEKAQKNKAGLSQKELDFFRDLLLAKRRELVGDMSSMEREALRETGSDLSTLPIHMADQGTDAYEQEFTLHLVEKDRGLLRELNDALAKIHNGSYGICEGTGLPISKPRLEAQPWARHSIEYARQLEQRKMPFRR